MNKDITISALKEYAKEHGLSVRFMDSRTYRGDFCIFIYDKANFRKTYAVGYDGSYNSTHGTDLDNCIMDAYRWIDERDKRFTFRDGRWWYGRFHFIVWKDGNSQDDKFHLTIEDADKAAEKLVKDGYCVVCYDTPPTGKTRLVKVYGCYERHVNSYVKRQIEKFKNIRP